MGTRYLSPLNFPYQSARVDAPGLRGPTELAIFVFGQRSGLSLPDPFRFRLSLKCVQGDSGPERQQEQAQNRSKRRMLLRGKHEYEEAPRLTKHRPHITMPARCNLVALGEPLHSSASTLLLLTMASGQRVFRCLRSTSSSTCACGSFGCG